MKVKKRTEVNNGGAKSVESECHRSTDETRERTDEKEKMKQNRKLKVNRGGGNRWMRESE